MGNKLHLHCKQVWFCSVQWRDTTSNNSINRNNNDNDNNSNNNNNNNNNNNRNQVLQTRTVTVNCPCWSSNLLTNDIGNLILQSLQNCGYQECSLSESFVKSWRVSALCISIFPWSLRGSGSSRQYFRCLSASQWNFIFKTMQWCLILGVTQGRGQKEQSCFALEKYGAGRGL